MKFFAICRKSDGAYLPAIVGKRCSTRAEPSLTAPPRLFRRKIDADNALDWWSRGVWREKRYGHVDSFGEVDVRSELHVDSVVGRKKDDFAVVIVVVSLLRKP